MARQPTIEFRKLEGRDLTQLHLWLNEGPVLQWYAKQPQSLKAIEEKYLPRIEGVDPVHVYISIVDDVDAGMLQTYRLVEHPDYARAVSAEPGWAGLDYFTGHSAFRGRGLGPHIVDKFVREVVFALDGIRACVTGPEPENRISIRTLLRAGFTHLRTVEVAPDEVEYLMIRYDPRAEK